MVSCIVDDEKQQRHLSGQTFLNTPEEEMFKYFDLFRKGLSGKKGKNLYNLEFKPDTGTKVFLKRVRDTKLKEDTAYEILLENIIDYYNTTGWFAIFIIHGAYDIPGIATDKTEMEDASEEIYEYLMTFICPITLSNPGLSFGEEKNKIGIAERYKIIGQPTTAFIYPAFNDRSTDWDHVWYYSKKPNEPDEGLINNVLGCQIPKTPETQKEDFRRALYPATFSIYEMEKIKTLFEKLAILALNQQDDEEEISEEQILKTLCEVGIEAEEAAVSKEAAIMLQNVINTKTLEIGTASAHVTVAADRTDVVDIRNINGENCIVVKTDGITHVNGIEVAGNEA